MKYFVLKFAISGMGGIKNDITSRALDKREYLIINEGYPKVLKYWDT